MSLDPTDVVGLERQQDAKREEDRQYRQRLAADWTWLMSQKRGRRLVWRLLSQTGLFRSSFTGSNSQTFFNEGQRNVGLWITALLTEHCPEDYAKMTVEQREYQK